MKYDKPVLTYLFLILFAGMTTYTFLLRASLYGENGLPKDFTAPVFRVMGENGAADYALFSLLEDKNTAEAYDAEKQTDFMKRKVMARGRFYSSASPVKSFLAVPWLTLPYYSYFETFLFWGMFLFGAALYALFPITQAILLLFAMPAAFLSFSFGGFGLYAAAALIFSLALAETHPRWSMLFTGFLIIEPVAFILAVAALIVRKRKITALSSTLFGAGLILASALRYGGETFLYSLTGSFSELMKTPCAFLSFFSLFVCNGFPAFVGGIIQTVAGAVLVYYGYCLFYKKPLCSDAVRNAYLCSTALLLTPAATFSDVALFYAGLAFFLKDCDGRGFLKGDLLFVLFCFSSVYVENAFLRATGISVQLVLAAILPVLCYRRAD